MKKMVVVFLCLLSFYAGNAIADVTLQEGQKFKLETGFTESYAGNLKQIVWKYTIPSTYLRLDTESLASADDIYETVDGDMLTGVFTATVREGVVAAPVFEAIAATPMIDTDEDGVADARGSVEFTDVSVVATSVKDKSINVVPTLPEVIRIEPEPEEPSLAFRFLVVPIAST